MADFSKPLTNEQESEIVAGMRKQRARLFARGGRKCHCGGLIYPTPEGERHTCTHGGEPLARAEIAEIWARWDAEDAATTDPTREEP